MAFTREEYCDMYLVLGECHKNTRLAADRYREIYENRRVQMPSFITFQRLNQRLRETGSVEPQRREGINNNEEIFLQREDLVLEALRRNPNTSCRQLERHLNVPKSVVNCITRRNGIYPYHYCKVQQLEDADFSLRRRFCRWILRHEEEVPYILWTDESSFTREGIFNVHNEHKYSEDNPFVYREGNFQRRFKINICAGVVGDRIIGPYMLPRNFNVNKAFFIIKLIN